MILLFEPTLWNLSVIFCVLMSRGFRMRQQKQQRVYRQSER